MILRIVFTSVSWLLLAAHFSRADNTLLAVISLCVPFLLFIKKRWSHATVVILTLLGSLIWLLTAWSLVQIRIDQQQDWARMALILLAVSLFTLLSAAMLNSKKIRKYYNTHSAR